MLAKNMGTSGNASGSSLPAGRQARNYQQVIQAAAFLAKRMKRVSLKFFWKGEQFARVPGSSRPVNEISVLFKLCNLPKPLCLLLVRDGHHVGKITRPQAAADRQLNSLQ